MRVDARRCRSHESTHYCRRVPTPIDSGRGALQDLEGKRKGHSDSEVITRRTCSLHRRWSSKIGASSSLQPRLRVVAGRCRTLKVSARVIQIAKYSHEGPGSFQRRWSSKIGASSSRSSRIAGGECEALELEDRRFVIAPTPIESGRGALQDPEVKRKGHSDSEVLTRRIRIAGGGCEELELEDRRFVIAEFTHCRRGVRGVGARR